MMMAIFKSSGDRETSLLAEAPLLVFADGKDALFSRQRTPGKEPLLAGNRETRQTTIFPGKKLEGSFFQDYFKRVLKTKRWNIECSNLPLKSEYVQQGTVMIF